MKKVFFLLALLGFLGIAAEVAAQITYRVVKGRFVWSAVRPEGEDIFEPHPFLVGVPRPGGSVEKPQFRISINSAGYRGPPLRQGARRVLCLGGSTTFCVLLSDEETWPSKLQEELRAFTGGPIDVINAAVPGYTSAENLIQFALRDHYLEPALVILYQGLNDLHTAHSPDFTTDYANSHGRLQAQVLQLEPPQRSLLAFPLYLRELLKKALPPAASRSPVRSSTPDERLGKVYRSNLRSIAALAREYRTPVIFVPQLLRSSLGPSERWLPHVALESIDEQMAYMNGILGEVAAEAKVPFVREVLEGTWTDSDFVDYCHFSTAGCAKMASILSKFIREHQLLQPP